MPRHKRGLTGPSAELLPLRPDQRVAALAAESWGIVSVAELLACGLSHDAIASRRRRGHLHRLHRGSYAVGHPSPPWQGRLLAAGKACGPDAVLSHFSAAALWGFMDYDADRHPDVTVPGVGGERHPRIRVHRTSVLSRQDRSEAQRVPVTAPGRTLLDLAALFDGPALRSAVRRAQGLRLVNLRQLNDVLGRLAPGGALADWRW